MRKLSALLCNIAAAAWLSFLALAGAPAQAAEPAALERTIPDPVTQSPVAPMIDDARREQQSKTRMIKRFTLGAVNIQGATTFTREELSQYFEPLLASEVDGAALAQLAARITQRYRHAGYLLSYASIPAQRVEAGMVRLAVVEGKIDRVTFDGAGPDRAALEAIARPLLADAPLKVATLERVIGLMRDFPGLSIADVTLTRTDPEAGLYGLKIRVARNRVRSLAYADNRGTDSVGRMRFYSSTSLSSLAVDGDELRVNLFTMPGRRFRYFYGQVLASVPIGRNGVRLTVAASRGDQYLRQTDRLDADSRNISAEISYPVLRSRAFSMVGRASFNDWRSSADEDGVAKLRDRIRVARIGVEFSTETRTRVRGELTLSRGLGLGETTAVGDPRASRPNAGGRFLKAAFTLQATHPLSEKVRVHGAFAGQYSTRPLLSVEEFALGGSRIGRAFDFNAATGDHGIGGMLEISYRLGDLKRGPQKMELFAYADGGGAFRKRSASGYPDEQWRAGTGLGARFSLGRSTISGEVGVPLTAGNGDRDVRGFFSVTRAF